MKKFFAIMLLATFLPVGAETVSSVSFNPSRLGNYEQLKVSGFARLQGGLETPEMNISSNYGVITVENNSTTQVYQIGDVVGVQNTAIDMQRTDFVGADFTGADYDVALISPAGQIPTTMVSGGKLTLENDSFIGVLTAHWNLLQYAVKVDTDSIDIGANSGGGEIDLLDLNTTGLTTYGFLLAGNDIPYPAGKRVEECVQDAVDPDQYNCDQKATGLAGCVLSWLPRQTNETAPRTVYVLGMNCNN